MRRLIFVALSAAIFATLAVTPALAGKGGNGGGGGGGNSTNGPSVTASPSSGTVGQPVYISGCGFAFEPVVLSVVNPSGSVQNYNVAMWSTGCLAGGGFVPTERGDYTLNILQANHGQTVTVASTTVNVQ